MRIALILIVAALLSFVGVTYLALEISGVIIVQTEAADGSGPRQTHIWYVEQDDRLFLEAGHPENPWVLDLTGQDAVVIVDEQLGGRYSYAVSGPGSHTEIRRLMREKYGWRDAWISLIFDTSQSFQIELGRLPEQAAGAAHASL